MRAFVLAIPIAVCGVLLTILPGCGSGDADGEGDAAQTNENVPPPPPQAPAVPTHQASPEALVAHAKRLLDATPPKWSEFLDLCEWESPQESAWEVFLRNYSVPLIDLKDALKSKFGNHGLREKVPFDQMRITDAKLTKKGPERAEARFRDGSTSHVLHLVNTRDRWWISGATFERAGKPHLKKYGNGSYEMLRQSYARMSGLAQRTHDLARRVRLGEFATEEAVRSALETAVNEEEQRVKGNR